MDKDSCEAALKLLNIDVTNLEVSMTARPAGCYWEAGNKGYFNNEVDSSKIDPSLSGEQGGVCENPGS